MVIALPIFDFRCLACDLEQKDVLLRMNDGESKFPHCTNCGATMEKQYGVANGAFKGKGFHRNDYGAPTRGY